MSIEMRLICFLVIGHRQLVIGNEQNAKDDGLRALTISIDKMRLSARDDKELDNYQEI